jgi:hypothetical protein
MRGAGRSSSPPRAEDKSLSEHRFVEEPILKGRRARDTDAETEHGSRLWAVGQSTIERIEIEPRAESRELRAESRELRAEKCADLSFHFRLRFSAGC